MTDSLPGYVTDPDWVLKDKDAAWRSGAPPDYSHTREFYRKGKKQSHEAGSLPALVENLVKNWEIEASFKTDLKDWQTIQRDVYYVTLNGGPPISGEHMLKVGTYNGLLTASQYYDPESNNFEDSHKSFKRMMPRFAWEVLEVYCGPPQVVFKWRHWGEMLNDYVGFNNEGKKVRVKAHGGPIEIEGIVIAKVNDKLQLQQIDVWYDPLSIFNAISKNGTSELLVDDANGTAPTSGTCPVTGAAGAAH